MIIILCFVAFALIFLIPEHAMAHLVNTNVGEFYAGMMHPLTSAEHLLPTLAVALLAGVMAKQFKQAIVLVFPLALALGILIGSLSPGFKFAQSLNMLLLVGLGGATAFMDRISPKVITSAALLTGLVLGYRSGVDMVTARVGLQFLPGVALTGLVVMALGAAWVPPINTSKMRLVLRLTGATLSLAGLAMVVLPLLGLELQSIRQVGIPGQDELVRMVKSKELSLPVVFAALIGSMVWGAGHALTPGHGKALVGAYLVGARGTALHAVYLGLTVTATHTLMVFALGLITLFASHYIVPGQLYPWLALISGLIIVVMGATMAVVRLRTSRSGHSHDHHHEAHTYDHPHADPDVGHHHHDHSHEEPHHHEHDHKDHRPHGHSHLPPGADGSPVSWRSLLGLGISGGLLPCPAALVLLLAAISLGRVGFGMILVVVFSLGLAGVLIVVGLLFIKGGQLLARIPRITVLSRWLPAFSALVIFGIGVVITIQAAIRI